MAIYSLSASSIGRGQGRQCVAAAAYRAGEKLVDERTGRAWDFTSKGGVLHSEIATPAAVPIWAGDRERLWNEAERAEDKSTRRDTAKTAREFRIALPNELEHAERVEVTRAFAHYLVDRYGVVVDFSIHTPSREGDQRNFHAHVMMTTRALGPEGYGGKIRVLDSPRTSGPEMEAIRSEWRGIANRALEAGGHAERIDHRSYARRGGDQEPTVHLGVAAMGMERRGETTDVGDKNRDAQARNAERSAVKVQIAAVEAQIIDLAVERAKRSDDRGERSAVRTSDPARILDQITERRSTFTRADLNYVLSKDILDAKARAAMNEAILARPEVVALREKPEGPVSRYTTRGVLEAERDVLTDTKAMASDGRHGLTSRQQAEALDHHAYLDREQRSAFGRATGPEGFAIVAGEAGTGKSATMAAIREAYEGAGRRVVGLSWTNSVVEDMRRDGFGDAATVSSALFRLEHGSEAWDARTVLMVDEAAMLSTKHLAAVTARAREAGAKLILVGDDRQLASIERGGLFGALKETHGGAELHTVRRVSEADQRTAFNMMHRGDFRAALGLFEARGAINWTQTAEEARSALVAKYRTDLEADGSKSRFVFAYTNADVAALNGDLRAMQRARGVLGEDHRFVTKDGVQAFAVGDRVQFTGNATRRPDKIAGFVNGAVGTVQGIEGERMTVELDGRKGGEGRRVSFTIGDNAEAGEFNALRHGYAGTIYKGQGKTLDQTYLLHSMHWRESSSYVAWTRHREAAAVFVAKDTAADLDQLARQMGRVDERRSASQFHHDPVELVRPSFEARSFDRAATQATARPGEERGDDAHAPASPAFQRDPTVREQAEAQRKAAIIGRSKDPAKVAQALHRAHVRDSAASGRSVVAEAPVHPQSREATRYNAALAKLQAHREAFAKQELGGDRARPRGRTR
jgi:Ti-type conjugative transfer relaxase TraA